MTAAERIFAEALALPEDERIELAERLLQSANDGGASRRESLQQAARLGFEELDAGLGVELTSAELVARLKAKRALIGE